MIGEEHQALVKELGEALQAIDMHLFADGDYSTRFKDQNGWIIEYESERYYPGYNLIIYPSSNTSGYVLSLLKEIFNEETGVNKKRNFSESVSFIIDNKDWIFQTPQPYKARYDELNEIV